MADNSRSAVSRIASRAESPLKRKSVAGGGEVFTGPLASRALKTLGARAMTVDRSIIVQEGFNEARPEDQALFAHEQHHVQNSGGNDEHGVRDGEEVAARAIERMVLHRHSAGGIESHEAGHATGSGGFGGSVNKTRATGERGSGEGEPNAARGYQRLKAQGLNHIDIVEKIAREVIRGMDESRDSRNERFADKKGFL